MGILPEEEAKNGPVLQTGVQSSLTEDAMMLHEEGTLASLWSSLRDAFFPAKLPPLVLESKPIPVIDRMKTKQNPRATAASMVIYALLILLFAWMVKKHVQFAAPHPTTELTALTQPPPISKMNSKMGGGGGQKGATPVTKGQLPKFVTQQITPPKAPPMEDPKIRMPDASVEVQKDLKMANNNMPNFGMPNASASGVSSMGNGSGTGIGNGRGSGIGPGSGSNTGSGAMNIGGEVSGPSVIYKVTPEFSEEARKAKFTGVVLVGLIVDERGMPQNVHVIRGVGMGLDEKAVEAVKQFRFKPGKFKGKPVATHLNFELSFDIF